MRYPIITIGREYGSGGRLIGQEVSQALGIPFYDKEIITLTARKSGLSEQIIAAAEGTKTQSLLYGLYTSTRELPINDQVFIAQAKIIRDLADEGGCVIVGRCGDYVLRERENCLRVFIHAPFEERVQRAVDAYNVREKNPEAFVRKEDKRRASYYSHFTQDKWGAPQNYHLSVNSTVGLREAAYIIQSAAKGDVL